MSADDVSKRAVGAEVAHWIHEHRTGGAGLPDVATPDTPPRGFQELHSPCVLLLVLEGEHQRGLSFCIAFRRIRTSVEQHCQYGRLLKHDSDHQSGPKLTSCLLIGIRIN
jgi:hypothetical protein